MRNVALLAALAAAAVTALVAHAGGAAPTAAPTYNRDVAPILDAKCASCHRLGGIAPFPLTTAADAPRARRRHRADDEGRADAAVDARARLGRDRRPRRAPPDARRALDARRVGGRGRARRATPADRHTKPCAGAGLGGPGATITLAPPKAYSPHAAGGGIDDYHCFLLDPKLRQNAFVTAALIRPQRTGIVHHVILYEAAGAQAAAATQLNAAHGGKGWTCFGGPGPAGRPRTPGRARPARPAAVDRRVGARPHDERAAGRHRRAAAQGREDRDAGALQPDRTAPAPDRSRAELRLRPGVDAG